MEEYSSSDICKSFNINKTTLDYWRVNNKVQSYKKDRSFYFNYEEVENYIKEKNKVKKPNGIFCHICKETTKFKSWKSFVRNHLTKHNISSKEYYDRFLGSDDERYCKKCGKEKAFASISKGYKKFCSDVKCRGTNKEILEKIENTKLEKYGDKYFTNQSKARTTCKSRYGVEVYTNREKARITTLERFGTLNMFDVPNILDKRRKTCLERYGSEYFVNGNKISKARINKYKNKIEKYLKENNKELIHYKDSNIIVKCNKCQNISELTIKFAYSRYNCDIDLCLHCNPINSVSYELKQFLKDNGVDYEENNRTILNGKELDVYCKEQKIAIEYNGCFWHCSLFKNSSYHNNKLLLCQENNIRLIQIFEDSWINKRDIIKSMLLSIFNKVENKIFARNCAIKVVSKDDKNTFLNLNHLQGECESKVNYGLYYKDELISLMSFNRSRYKKYEWELVRFCNKLNSRVVGGASKLFKHFIRNNNPNNVVSYADRLWSDGNMYDKIGFNLSHISKPSYFYVSKNEFIRYHRFCFNKKNINIPNEVTEEEFVDKLGYFKIYNCGTNVYLWKRVELCQ